MGQIPQLKRPVPALIQLKNQFSDTMADGIRVAPNHFKTKSYDQVRVTFSPVSIIMLDESKQVFVFGGRIYLRWNDPDVKWNASKFDDIETVYMNTFPVPDTAIANGVGTLKLTKNSDVKITLNGLCSTDYMETFTTSCNVDPTLYPFDEQVCELVLIPDGSFTLVTDEIVSIQNEYFTNSSEWELLNVTVETRGYEVHGAEVNSSVFKFHLKRQSTFHIVTVLFPMSLLSFMNTFAFLLPSASGEKVSYLVSIFVSYAMFLNFIYDSMPKSGTITRMAIYLVLILLQSGLAILLSIVLLAMQLDSKGQKERFVRKMERILFMLFFVFASVSLAVFF
ncbi:acetylcholine receptor subunit beta-type acr-2-like [Gigantopelta aegis]|uniref:acetylcholine receptor subunit beta-type acr-2-like n=1 Tax=Gigantopelta aegis TaxID=1735272 RepID=UPI001B8886AE|nr:acetylcholine receptor subunit beta-type acr-2-like [Gigantopelta aegis]